MLQHEAKLRADLQAFHVKGEAVVAQRREQLLGESNADLKEMCASRGLAVGGGKEEKVERPVQENKERCWACNKKVGLTGFTCRCEYVFCSTHRYADEHKCTFDYKKMGREVLAKANPTVAADKLGR